MASGAYEHQHDWLECLECACPTPAPTTYHTHVSSTIMITRLFPRPPKKLAVS